MIEQYKALLEEKGHHIEEGSFDEFQLVHYCDGVLNGCREILIKQLKIKLNGISQDIIDCINQSQEKEIQIVLDLIFFIEDENQVKHILSRHESAHLS